MNSFFILKPFKNYAPQERGRWSMKKVTKSDTKRGSNQKGDITHSYFFYAHFSCNSILSSLVSDGVLIIPQ